MSESKPFTEFETQPKDSIELCAGPLEAQIDTQGARVDSLRFHGQDVFFPTQEVLVDGKPVKRGGMHVCLPQFGRDSHFGLPEHGFGRDVEWVAASSGDRTVSLSYEDNEGHEGFPAGLTANLTYGMYTTMNGAWVLFSELKLGNNGIEAEKLPVAPSFHPYFATEGRYVPTIRHRGAPIIDPSDETELANTRFARIDRPVLPIHNNGMWQANLRTENLHEFIFWSDDISRYLCLQPSAKGQAFLVEDNYQYVGVDETLSYRFDIEIRTR